MCSTAEYTVYQVINIAIGLPILCWVPLEYVLLQYSVYPSDWKPDTTYRPPSKPAKEYPFTLDPFQKQAIEYIERNESVLVSAHTSAGKVCAITTH